MHSIYARTRLIKLETSSLKPKRAKDILDCQGWGSIKGKGGITICREVTTCRAGDLRTIPDINLRYKG